jgi:CRP-like cAMP-binding protein
LCRLPVLPTDYNQGAFLTPKNSRPSTLQNQLLAALPGKEYQRLLPHLEPVPLPLREVLYESGEPIKHVYFPNDELISLLVVIRDGMPREVGWIGSEGMFGVPVVLGMNATPTRALIQMTGSAMRLKARTLTSELKRGRSQANSSAAAHCSTCYNAMLTHSLSRLHSRRPAPVRTR